jgi:aerobic-type carbon monoxide dehydrogenase small subunit (CoxS/CutS family)
MSKKQNNGVSRRQFLRGSALTAAGTTLVNSGLLAQSSGPASTAVGPGAVPITMRVNGKDQQLSVEPRTTLAEALRDVLHLTGTKVVCDRGACSACTVWIDGTPVNSCLTFALDIGQREVTTIEGLGTPEHMHPVQAAFVEHDATQCGYCTPGMVMSTAALLKANPNPTLEDVQHAVRGNLCRCGTYPKVFEAALAAARKGA